MERGTGAVLRFKLTHVYLHNLPLDILGYIVYTTSALYFGNFFRLKCKAGWRSGVPTILYLWVIIVNAEYLLNVYAGVRATSASLALTYVVHILILTMFKTVVRIWRRFTAVPGPLIVKLTVLWKFFHLLRGTYESAVKKLHLKHGDVVQVGPYEYSVWNVRFFEQCSKLPKADPPSHLRPLNTVINSLHGALNMANVFAYEPDINACNYKLLETLARYAETKEDVRFADLIACYAYDVLFATSTGQRAGFLDKPKDAAKITESLSNWKFYSILYESYLRLHPLIDKVVRLFTKQQMPSHAIFKFLNMDGADEEHCMANKILELEGKRVGSAKAVQEACAALIAAGADPAIIHMLSSLYYIYRDSELLVKLRMEIEQANLESPATFKELIHRKPKMPLLHAVMNESLRLHQPTTNGFNYVTPQGGIVIDNKRVPENCTICLQPSMAQVNPTVFGEDAEAWRPHRWLDKSLKVQQIRSHMRASGAGTNHCPGRDLHKAIVAKTLTQIIPNFDIAMSASNTYTTPVKMTLDEIKECFVARVSLPKNMSVIITPQSPLRATAPAFAPETTTAPEVPPGLTPRKITFTREDCNPTSGFDAISSGKYVTALTPQSKEFVPSAVAHGADNPVKVTDSTSPTLSSATTLQETPARFDDVETLEYYLGREVTSSLLKSFDPSQEKLQPARAIKGPALRSSYERAMVHEAAQRIWGDRLAHRTEFKSKCMWFSLPRNNNNNNAADRNAGRTEGKDAKRTGPNERPATAPVRPRDPPPVHAEWGAFAKVENAAYMKKVYADEDSGKDKIKFADLQKSRNEWFAEKSASAKAQGADQVLKSTFKQTNGETKDGRLGGVRKYINEIKTDENGEIVVETDSDNDSGVAIEKPVTQRKAALPPHLRKKSAANTGAAANDNATTATGTTDTEATQANAPATNEWVAARLPAI